MGLKGLTDIFLPSPPVLFNTIEYNHSQQCPLGIYNRFFIGSISCLLPGYL